MTSSITIRAYRPDDAEQVVALINADAYQTIGVARAVVDGVGNIRLSRYVPSSSRKVVAVNSHGEPVGYAYFVSRERGIVSEVGGAVHPDWWGKRIGALLVEWAQQQALVAAQQAPPGIKTVLQTQVFDSQVSARALFQAYGFQEVREWTHFVCELQTPPAPPRLSGNLHIREMDLNEDWELVGPVLDQAFTNHWGAITQIFDEPVLVGQPEATQESDDVTAGIEDSSYSNSAGFCFLAIVDQTVIGGILCNAKLVERPDSGRVGSLFILPAYQRRGIGRALMETAFNTFWQHGLRRIILDTDAQSFSHSPRFYTALGMRQYRRELVYEQTIRSGHEIRRLTA